MLPYFYDMPNSYYKDVSIYYLKDEVEGKFYPEKYPSEKYVSDKYMPADKYGKYEKYDKPYYYEKMHF